MTPICRVVAIVALASLVAAAAWAQPQVVESAPNEVDVRGPDLDGDGMPDSWERFFGLDPLVDDGGLDRDDDGVSNRDEFRFRTLPTAVANAWPYAYAAERRYAFAEGLVTAQFVTVLTLTSDQPFGPSGHVQVQTFGEGGHRAEYFVTLPPGGSVDVDARAILGGWTGAFGFLVSADVPVVVERRMLWGDGGLYGGHTVARSACPAWGNCLFAEGATLPGFDTYLLFLNLGNETVDVSVTYLMADGDPIVCWHRLPARARTTIRVSDAASTEPRLRAAEFGVSVKSVADDVWVERSMYYTPPGGPWFAAGFSQGEASASQTAYFAEGATGPFFDEFLLLANPLDEVQQVRASFLLEDGRVLEKTYALPPRSRRTIWVNYEEFPGEGRALAHTVHATRLEASGLVIAAERTMWWPATPGGAWTGVHNGVGAGQLGGVWAFASGSGRYGAEAGDTYYLVANVGAEPTACSILVADRHGRDLVRQRLALIPPMTRVTFWLEPLLASLPPPAGFLVFFSSTGLVVERASYTTLGSSWWRRGSAVMGGDPSR